MKGEFFPRVKTIISMCANEQPNSLAHAQTDKKNLRKEKKNK